MQPSSYHALAIYLSFQFVHEFYESERVDELPKYLV